MNHQPTIFEQELLEVIECPDPYLCLSDFELGLLYKEVWE